MRHKFLLSEQKMQENSSKKQRNCCELEAVYVIADRIAKKRGG